MMPRSEGLYEGHPETRAGTLRPEAAGRTKGAIVAGIGVVDDHPLIRKGLVQILTREPDLHVVGEAETAEEALTLVRSGCDLLLLDIGLPDRNGLELLEEIKEIDPDLPVLILSIAAEDQYGVQALKAGASGYVRKDSTPDVILLAIRKVLAGGQYLSERLVQVLADDERGGSRLPHDSLSPRELQVLCMLAAGESLTEIGRRLELSVKSVSTYRTRLLKKTGMRSNAEIARYAAQHNLVD